MTNKSFDERVEQEICIKYKGGQNSVELGEEYGVSKTTILKILRRYNVDRRSISEACKLKKSDKHSIVLPDMANLMPVDKYWLGFLLGDSCIYYPNQDGQSKILSVALKSSDKFHLERLKRYFNSSKKISSQDKGTDCLQIASDELVAYLEHFGIHQRKSGKEKAHPALADSRDFWRGLIDAEDGSLYQAEDTARLELTGSKEICEQFREYLTKTLDADYASSPTKEKTGCHSLVVGGNQKANRVIRHLYYDSCMSLTRKLILAMQYNCAKFEFHRLRDVSGVSGTGVVADGYVSRNGKVALFWCASEVKSVVIYDSLEEMFRIHNHEENSYIAWKENHEILPN